MIGADTENDDIGQEADDDNDATPGVEETNKDGVDQCQEEFVEGEVDTSVENMTSTSVAVFYLKWTEEGVVGGPRGGLVRMFGPEGRHYFYSLQVGEKYHHP